MKSNPKGDLFFKNLLVKSDVVFDSETNALNFSFLVLPGGEKKYFQFFRKMTSWEGFIFLRERRMITLNQSGHEGTNVPTIFTIALKNYPQRFRVIKVIKLEKSSNNFGLIWSYLLNRTLRTIYFHNIKVPYFICLSWQEQSASWLKNQCNGNFGPFPDIAVNYAFRPAG